MGEAGEALGAVKHLVGRGTNNKANVDYRAKAIEEIVDVWFYMVLVLEMLGVDYDGFLGAVDAKLIKNEARMRARAQEGIP